MGLHYLAFMGRDLENRKKLMPIWMMNSAGLCSKNIMNSAGIFNDNVSINNIGMNSVSWDYYWDDWLFLCMVLGV